MILTSKIVRLQLRLLKPLLTSGGIETHRKRQETIGTLMSRSHRADTVPTEFSLGDFDAAMINPRSFEYDGVILYLHGGGYIGGSIGYAKGFGSVLASEYRIKVCCPAYRLAPEHPYPAALEDALSAYRFLLESGYSPEKIILAGESAGGGLEYSLCLKLKELGLGQPGGIVSISPWTDLTCSGSSYEENKDVDPYITREQLQFYSECYASDPLVSPLFGDLSGLPRSLIFVGGDEVMLSDARSLHEKLLSQGCRSELVIADGMWHAYILYQVKETKKDYEKIRRFLTDTLGGRP
jgi:acetyl esterase/lipase